MTEPIDEFRGKYFFLSNFYSAPVEYQGYRFKNNEAAFQAAKCPERMLDFCNLTPRLAKWLGRKVPLRPDWELVKYDVMYEVCMAKFTQNPDLLSKLLATGDVELIEGNTWGDRVWGVDICDHKEMEAFGFLPLQEPTSQSSELGYRNAENLWDNSKSLVGPGADLAGLVRSGGEIDIDVEGLVRTIARELQLPERVLAGALTSAENEKQWQKFLEINGMR